MCRLLPKYRPRSLMPAHGFEANRPPQTAWSFHLKGLLRLNGSVPQFDRHRLLSLHKQGGAGAKGGVKIGQGGRFRYQEKMGMLGSREILHHSSIAHLRCAPRGCPRLAAKGFCWWLRPSRRLIGSSLLVQDCRMLVCKYDNVNHRF